MNMEILNKAQADTLFHREAVFLGTADAITEERAKELFGEEAVQFAARMSGLNGYGIGDYTAMYLDYKGFLTAVSYHNVEQIMDWTQKKGPTLNQPTKALECEAAKPTEG